MFTKKPDGWVRGASSVLMLTDSLKTGMHGCIKTRVVMDIRARLLQDYPRPRHYFTSA